MTSQSSVKPTRAQPEWQAALAEPPHAPLKMPRQTLERSGTPYGVWLAAGMARLTAALRGSLRRAG